MRTRIGECLIQAGLITEDDLRSALAEHQRTREWIGAVLVRMNLATEADIAKALAFQLGFPYINLAENAPDTSAVVLIPKDIALEHVCLAVSLEKKLLTVAMCDPLLFSLVQDFELQTGYRIRQVVAARGDIIDAIRTGYPDDAPMGTMPQKDGGVAPAHTAMRTRGGSPMEVPTGETALARPLEGGVVEPAAGLKELGEAAPIIDLVDLIVKSAIKRKASDVHVEPMEHRVLIRFRFDGQLKEVMDLPKEVHEGLIARLKIMAGMDIAERRRPQDGRLRSRTGDGVEVDFRVSMFGTLFGEKVVLRGLDGRKSVPALEEIGMSATALDDVRLLLRRQQGMILVVGPGGSGKTTTLCSALKAVASEKTSIVTLEDPIEYRIPGVVQTQIDEKLNLTFASGLRSILRQDPDVILLGEIRDGEAAKMAMQAAQTGRLVLSALHADDGASVVTRLADVGADPFVIASALVGVVAQRLVRRLCGHCRCQSTPPADVLRSLGIADADAALIAFYRAVGCDQCNHTGYCGRIGIYEVMRMTRRLRRLIAARAPEDQIRDAAVAGGMVTLGEDGLSKVKSGVTTPEEVLRVLTEVREPRMLCAACGTAVAVDFSACPQCGRRLGGACPHCGRALQPGWNFCPYCSRSTTSAGKAPGRLRALDRNPPAAGSEPPDANIAELEK